MKKNVRKKKKPVAEVSTEEKIKTAARIIFTQKGFKATRTRDIAKEAGINLALLNYYFRSKKKLFELVMTENLQKFMMGVALIANSKATTWQQKVDQLVAYYIDMLLENPDLPGFVLAEKENNPELIAKLITERVGFMKSVFMNQIREGMKKGEIAKASPMQYPAAIMGLIIFPFTGVTLIKSLGKMDDKQFNNLMQERKKLVPLWIKKIMLVKK